MSSANDIYLYEVPAFANSNDICLRITTSAQGVVGGNKRTKRQLAELLKAQREETFSRQKYEEDLKAAELAAAEAADKAKNAEKKAALEAAADAAAEVYEIPSLPRVDVTELTAALNAATSAKQTKEAIHQANIALALANHLVMEAGDQDEEEIIMMLLS